MEKERVISLKEGNRKCKKGRCDHPITNGPIIPTHPAVSVRPLPIPSGSGPSPHLACRAGQCVGDPGPRPLRRISLSAIGSPTAGACAILTRHERAGVPQVEW